MPTREKRSLPALPGTSKKSALDQFYKALKERRQPLGKAKKVGSPSDIEGSLIARDKKIRKMITGK